MTTTYVYPSAQRLQEIDQDLVQSLTPDDPIFKHFPMVPDNDDVLRWEIRDNYKGVQAIRGVNGDPPKIARTGSKGFLMEPGVYGEKDSIDERELQKARKLGTFGDRVDVTDLVRQSQDNLIVREITRIRQVLWTLATTGTFSVATQDGVIVQTDTLPLQTYTASVAWTTTATATPLADMRAAQLLGHGHGAVFNAKATLYINRVTLNGLLANTNSVDLGRVRVTNGGTANSIADANRVFLDNDLPQIEVMDDGYFDEHGAYQLFLANNKGVLIGVRPNNAPVGNYRLTYNVNKDGPGSYMNVVDNMGQDVPRNIVIGRGHNGGPVIYYPSAVVALNL